VSNVLWWLVRCLAMVVFINRYVGGLVMRIAARATWDATVDDYVPTVTVVIPLFNEGAGIAATLRSVLDASYPRDRLDVICVDDCSRDDSYAQACAVAAGAGGRLTVVRNPRNLGKRCSIIDAVRRSTSEIIVSVDSDVVIDPGAIRQLVRRFTRPAIAAVGGWVDVRNKHDNWLTRMQTVKYWYAYFAMRNIEWALQRMLCLSGCLTASRRAGLVELEPVLAGRALLGVPIKYGEDRFLTRQIVKAGYLTTMTLDARCCTFVPSTLTGYFSQQLRWRRSNIVDYAGGMSHVWRLNPVLAIHFFSLFALLLVYPIALVRALAAHKFFPALVLHAEAVAFFGLLYRLRTRKLPKSERVGPLSFVPLSFLMPVTYALLTPLALFTLDTGSWETRNHQEATPEPVAEPVTEPFREPGFAAELRLGVPANAAPPVTRTRSHAQLPAA
jgi:N-acetylglucosaminyltransferase